MAINHNASVENPVYDIGQLWRRLIAPPAACRMLLGTHCSLPERAHSSRAERRELKREAAKRPCSHPPLDGLLMLPFFLGCHAGRARPGTQPCGAASTPLTEYRLPASRHTKSGSFSV